MVVIGQSVGFLAELVLFGESSCFRAKVVFIRLKRLYSGKLVVFVQTWLLWGKSGCIRAD